VYVGLSSRSNAAAVGQLQILLAPFGYTVAGVEVAGCLHLKSAVTQIAEDALLVNPEWIDAAFFGGIQTIAVDPGEPYAANAVWIGGAVVYPTCFPATRRRIEALGIRVAGVDVSELQKAEGAVTCCSLVFRIE
jgi:dimethylargininase